MTAFAIKLERTVDDTVPYASLTFLGDEPMGSGTFGAVYKALHQEWGCQVAYKKLIVHSIRTVSKDDQQ